VPAKFMLGKVLVFLAFANLLGAIEETSII
jgi:hypothetical protein